MPRSFLVCLFLTVAVAAVGMGSEVRLLAPGPLRLVATPKLEPCTFRSVPQGAVISCPQPQKLEVTVELEGFEEKTLVLEPRQDAVDLRGELWTPKPVILELSEASGPATALWWEDQGLTLRAAEGGRILGPRPVQGVTVALVGPQIKAETLNLMPHHRGKAVPVKTSPGVSAAVVCLDPWTSKPLRDCRAKIGRTLEFLKSFGAALAFHLTPVGQVREFPGATLWELGDKPLPEKLWVQVEANAGAPVIQPFTPSQWVQEVQLPHPSVVRVFLESDRGEKVQGTVRVNWEANDIAIRLLEKPTDPSGFLELTLAPGAYTVVGDAPGFAPEEERVRVGGNTKTVRLVLPQQPQASGLVLDPEGQPIPEARVMALGPGLRPESPQNMTTTAESGAFAVTLPGEGPWTLRVEKEGFATTTVPLTGEAKNLVVVLAKRCEVTLALYGPGGIPLIGTPVMVLRWDTLEPVPNLEQPPSNRYRFALSPGSWEVIVESHEPPLFGKVEIPPSCDGLEIPVTLSPAKQGLPVPPEVRDKVKP